MTDQQTLRRSRFCLACCGTVLGCYICAPLHISSLAGCGRAHAQPLHRSIIQHSGIGEVTMRVGLMCIVLLIAAMGKVNAET